MKSSFNPERILENPYFSDEEKLKAVSSEQRQLLMQNLEIMIEQLTDYMVRFNDLKKKLEGMETEAS